MFLFPPQQKLLDAFSLFHLFHFISLIGSVEKHCIYNKKPLFEIQFSRLHLQSERRRLKRAEAFI